MSEFIGQDTTRVAESPSREGPVPEEFRTPPGINPGLDPGTPEQRGAD